MAGLREKKKARTKEEILQSAIELFAEKGYNATTIEEIAERAVVGVGTVYNYFGSKRGLLLAYASREHEHIARVGKEIIDRAGDNPEETVVALMWGCCESFLKHDRSLVRQILIASFEEIDSIGKEMARLDYELIDQIADLLRNYQQQGQIAADLPVQNAAMTLYGVMTMVSMAYLGNELEENQLVDTIREQVKLVFRGWLPKEENPK